MLDSLVYRPLTQTHALITQLVQRSLPDLTRSAAFPRSPIDYWQDILSSSSEPGIRIVPVISKGDPPSKSGPVVARFIQRHLRVNSKWIWWPDDVRRKLDGKIHTIVFVDDFLGTGYQFLRFFRQEGFGRLDPRVTLVYAPLVAHERGVLRLRQSLGRVHLAWVESLDHTYSLFSPVSDNKLPPDMGAEALRKIYDQYLKNRQLHVLPKRILGYGQLGLCFSFEHATPNAALPLLWLERSHYIPLFKR